MSDPADQQPQVPLDGRGTKVGHSADTWDTLPAIGHIVGECRPQEFEFVTSQQLAPPRLEYLAVPGIEERSSADGRPGPARRVDILAQVTSLSVDSSVLSHDLTYDETRAILGGDLAPPPKILGQARVIGYLEDGRVRTPRSAAMPGQTVYVAPDSLLRVFFSRTERGLTVGHLLNRPQVEVLLDPNGLRRHLAIIAQTGAGKSYLAGKLLESLVELGATVLVLDPNSDYVQLRKAAVDAESPFDSARKTSFAERVDIYRVPGIKYRRYGEDLIGLTQDFEIQFSGLEDEEVSSLAGVPANARNIRAAIAEACRQLHASGRDYRPAELVAMLQTLHADRFEGAQRAIKYVEALVPYSVWGFRDVPMEQLVRPKRISIIDLAGTERTVAAYVADKALRWLWTRATTGQLPHPVFLVLEEAHNLVPNDQYGTRASRIITTVASEGRKFGVYLVVITQRPSKIDPDVLSQCGSQLIMQLTNPDDQVAVQRASEAISKELLENLPGLNQGEAIVLGQLTRIPAMVRIAGRQSAEGGADIDLLAALSRAELDAATEERLPAVVPHPVLRHKEPF